MTRKIYIYLLFCFLLLGCDHGRQIDKKFLLVNDHKINVIKNRIKNKLPEYSAAYSLLLKEADNLLLESAYSSGALPRYPQKNNSVLDLKGRRGALKTPHNFVNEQMKDIWILTMAWLYSNNEMYANEASILLRSFFIDSFSKLKQDDFLDRYVNDLSFQSEGMMYEMNSLIFLTDAVKILAKSNSWCAEETSKVKQWYKRLARLMADEAIIRSWKKNHNTYFDCYLNQMLCFNYFVGNPSDSLRNITSQINSMPGHKQMRQPKHLKDYPILSGDILLCQIANKIEKELKVGSDLQSALTIKVCSCSDQGLLNVDQLEGLQFMLLITEGAFELVENTPMEFVYRSIKSNHRVLLFPR